MEGLLLLARGLSNRQIAASLHRSEATIKRHIANIEAKSGAQSRTNATRKTLSEGRISLRVVTQGNEEG